MTRTMIEPKYKVGDKVTFINDYGLNFGLKEIIGIKSVSYSHSGYGYFIKDSDSPWFAIKEENLTNPL